jgi:hypothetical protein
VNIEHEFWWKSHDYSEVEFEIREYMGIENQGSIECIIVIM